MTPKKIYHPGDPLPSLSENSRRALSLIFNQSSDGYTIMNRCDLKDAKELADALGPLMSNGLLFCAGSPYISEKEMMNAFYAVPLGAVGYTKLLLSM